MADWVWAGLLGAAAGLEAWAMWRSRDGIDRGTLSRLIRRTFRTHCRAGRIAFAATWSGVAAWMLCHILTGNKPSAGVA